jgi:hypothetical protein
MTYQLHKIYNESGNDFKTEIITEFNHKPSFQEICKIVPSLATVFNCEDYIMNEYMTCAADGVFILKEKP